MTYCPGCGSEVEDDWSHCPECGDALVTSVTSEDESDSQSAPEQRPKGKIPDHFGHLFGDVYVDTRWYYGILEASGGLLILLPPRLFGRLFRDPLLWILQQDPEAFLWVATNYRTIGFVLIGVSLGLRLKIDPDPVEPDDPPDDANGQRHLEEKQPHSHSDREAEDSDGGEGDEQPSFFTLYWLPWFSE